MSVKPSEVLMTPMSLGPIDSPMPHLPNFPAPTPTPAPRAHERIAVAAIPDEIPPEIVKPSVCERAAALAEDTLRLAGTGVFGALAIWSGATVGATAFTIASAATSATFLALHIIDKTCGRGNSSTELLNRSIQWYATLQQEQKRMLAEQRSIGRSIQEASDHDKAAIEASGSIVQAGIADTAKLGQTVVDLQHGIAAMTPIQQELQDSLKNVKEENVALKTQLAKFEELFNKFQENVQISAQSIPELAAIELSWDHSVGSFKENSSKVLEGFKQLLAQLNGHSELVESLKSQKDELELQLGKIKTEVDEMRANNAHLSEEMEQLTHTSQAASTLNQMLENLGKKLDLDDSDVDQQTLLFQQEKAEFNLYIQNLQQAATKISTTSTSSAELTALLEKHRLATEQQARRLEEGSL